MWNEDETGRREVDWRRKEMEGEGAQRKKKSRGKRRKGGKGGKGGGGGGTETKRQIAQRNGNE